MQTAAWPGDSDGFALLEVLVTAALVVTVAAGASQVLAIAMRAGHAARVRTMASMLASQKLEQLRSLEWSHTSGGSPAISVSSSDVTSDLSADPATDGGSGLMASPRGTLESDVAQYVDYLDSSGTTVRGPGAPPPAAVYVRRWAVRLLNSDPENTLVLSVLVTTRAAGGVASVDAARLATIISRK